MTDSYSDNRSPEEKYQQLVDDRQNLMGYCKNIMNTLDELPQDCGERALWELVQNARDQAEGDCHIHIQLNNDSVVFRHKGRPFDYNSLSALVKQTSSKDKQEQVGRYGTGFMTTHYFNEVVKVEGWFEVKKEDNRIEGYVPIDNLILKRDIEDLDEFIKEMRHELDYVSALWKSKDKQADKGEWTQFTYKLSEDKVAKVSNQLARTIRLMPIVLTINKTIAVCEIEDNYAKKHVIYHYDAKNAVGKSYGMDAWLHKSMPINCTDCINNCTETYVCNSLQSVNGDDIIIIPPFPIGCEDVDRIPSLFLWFPLIGTENFGVNFIFHSRRFHPVEKRNDIQLPRDVEKKANKGAENETVLNQMMQALFAYYEKAENIESLPRDFARVYIRKPNEDPVRQDFLERMHTMWVSIVKNWRVIPTVNGKQSIEEQGVKVLHPSFYEKLTQEQRATYEPVLMQYVQLVEDRFCPTSDLIWWSQTINEWSYEDSRYCLKPEAVCQTIKQKTDHLYDFLKLLKDTGNDTLFGAHAIIPNREGTLCTKGSLKHWPEMTDELYCKMKVLMGSGAANIVDPQIIAQEITTVGDYDAEALKKDISDTIRQWREKTIGSDDAAMLDKEELDALISICSSFSLDNPNNMRSRLMDSIARIHDRQYKYQHIQKLMEEEEDKFYKAPFNFLAEYTLYVISKNEKTWVEENMELLLEFLKTYTTSNKKEDWLDRLDKYAVIPNQNNDLCLYSSLYQNVDTNTVLEELYERAFGKSLKNRWVHEEISTILPFDKQTKESVAEELEKLLLDDYRKGVFTHKKVMLNLISRMNEVYDGDADPTLKWSQLFETFCNESPKIVFNMKTGDEQKDLFKIMGNLDASNLKRMAVLTETPDVGYLLDKMEQQEQLRKDNEARFNHLHIIGKYIEDQLRELIQSELVKVNRPKKESELSEGETADTFGADDVQDGQDIIISKKVGDQWENVFYVEVKSKWDFNEPAHMSTRQVRNAALHPEMYALCCVDLREHKHEDLTSLSLETIIKCTKVKMGIGDTLNPLVKEILAADGRSDDEQIKISDYRSNMGAGVFTKGDSLCVLMNKIKEIIKI